MLIITALVACAPLIPIGEIPIVDYADSDPSFLKELEAEILQFEHDSARDGVSVAAIHIVPEVDEDPHVYGWYFGPGEPILVDVDSPNVRWVIRHELCHALHGDEGLGEDFFELVEPAELSEEHYGDEDVVTETFARHCDDGPAESPDSEPEQWLLDNVWLGVR